MWSKAVEIGDFGGGSLESPRRWLWPLSGWASLWECRAAQSRQARSEDAQGGSWRSAKGGGLTMLGHGSNNDCSCVTEHDVERDLAADGERGEVGGQHENHQFALEPEPHAMRPVRESGHKAQERGRQVAQPGVPHGTHGTCVCTGQAALCFWYVP